MRILFAIFLTSMTFLNLPSYANAEEKVMSVDWYKQPENRAALEAKLRECKENPELPAKDRNCQNAADASVLRSTPRGKTIEPAIPDFTAPAKRIN